MTTGKALNGKRSFQRAFALGICAAAAFSPSFADTNITENVTLTEDADWTSHGTVNLSGGVVVDLNGHDLRVGGLAGEGRFVSSEELIVNGSFEQIEGATGTHQDFSETVYPTGWTTANANLATVGWAASRDTIWSKNFDAQNGSRFVWWWCNDNTSGGASLTQKVNVAKADIYRLSFYTAYRPGGNVYKNMRIHVDVDGNTLGYAVCSTAAWTSSRSPTSPVMGTPRFWNVPTAIPRWRRGLRRRNVFPHRCSVPSPTVKNPTIHLRRDLSLW